MSPVSRVKFGRVSKLASRYESYLSNCRWTTRIALPCKSAVQTIGCTPWLEWVPIPLASRKQFGIQNKQLMPCTFRSWISLAETNNSVSSPTSYADKVDSKAFSAINTSHAFGLTRSTHIPCQLTASFCVSFEVEVATDYSKPWIDRGHNDHIPVQICYCCKTSMDTRSAYDLHEKVCPLVSKMRVVSTEPS